MAAVCWQDEAVSRATSRACAPLTLGGRLTTREAQPPLWGGSSAPVAGGCAAGGDIVATSYTIVARTGVVPDTPTEGSGGRAGLLCGCGCGGGLEYSKK